MASNNHKQHIDDLLIKHTGYRTVEELWDAAVDLKYSEKSLDDLKKDLDSMKELDYALCQYSKSSLDATIALNARRIGVYDSILEVRSHSYELYEVIFPKARQCELNNYVGYANLKQNPATAHLSDYDRLEAIELLEDLRSQLGEIEVEADTEHEKQVYLSELDLAVSTYISEMQKTMEGIKRAAMWDDMQKEWDDMLKEENRVRENIDVIAPVPASVATVVESSPDMHEDIRDLLVKHTGYPTVEKLWDAAVNIKYSEESVDDLKKDLDLMKKLDDALCQYSKNSLDATIELNISRFRVYDSVLKAPPVLFARVFTADQQCEIQNYRRYADLKQDPTDLHDNEAFESLVKLKSELDEIEAKAFTEHQKQTSLSELDLAVCTYISEVRKKLEEIKRVKMWDDIQKEWDDKLKEENRVRENIDVITPVPVSVATVVEHAHGTGYGGSGFKFNEEEDEVTKAAKKKAQARAHGYEEEKSDSDSEDDGIIKAGGNAAAIVAASKASVADVPRPSHNWSFAL